VNVLLLTFSLLAHGSTDAELSRTAGTEAGHRISDACSRPGAPLYEVDHFGTLPEWFSPSDFDAALREQLPPQAKQGEGLFDTTTRAEQDTLMRTHSGVWLVELFPSRARLDVSFSGRCAQDAMPVAFVGSYEPQDAPAVAVAAPAAEVPTGDLAAMAAAAKAAEAQRLEAVQMEADARAAEALRVAQILTESTERVQAEASRDFADIEELINQPAALYAPILQTYLDRYDGASVSAGGQVHPVQIDELRPVRKSLRRIENGNLRTRGQRQRLKLGLSGLAIASVGAAGLGAAVQQRSLVVQEATAANYTRAELEQAVRRTNLRLYAGYTVLGAGVLVGGVGPLFVQTGATPSLQVSTRW
jgi:hypothetical protein